ncbi:type II CAAX prenyl endopeptidase Rce1 family protein [Enterococcus plantarum]|uniref:CPBP family glutamic-type intramembrane protease n=1 Tax=Enterococcus plantarum TaxID=1077675 RepID=UPI001A8E736A|nr:CPBP family intramembrane metalloprotease [Enterococcus plantarum]
MILKVIYILIYFLITELIPSVGVSWDLSNPIFVLIQKVFFVLLAILLFKNDLWFRLKEVKLKQTIMPICGTFLFMCLTYLLVVKILGTGLAIGKYNVSFILILEAVLITPFIEEIVFRYCFINSRKIYVMVVQILLSSTWFMYGHAAAANYNYILLIPYFVLGILLSLIYVRKNNIWYSILIHSSYNFVILVISAISN